MFDKLEDTLLRFDELLSLLSEPDVANDPKRFQRLMKEQSDLAPIVEAYKEYKQCNQNMEDSLAMLQEESDEELRELAKEELNESKERVAEDPPSSQRSQRRQKRYCGDPRRGRRRRGGAVRS